MIRGSSSENTRQRGLFQDPEVGTEAHDDVVAWLASEKGKAEVARNLNWALVALWQPPHTDEYRVAAIRCKPEDVGTAYNSYMQERNARDYYEVSCRVYNTTAEARLEVLFSSKTGFIIGFADLIVETERFYDIDNHQCDTKGTEIYKTHFARKRRKILIEVKTGRLHLGEVLRQMNTYAEFDSFTDRLIVVRQRPPAHYVEALASQNISVALFKPEEETLEWLTIAPSAI